ncbi:MAG: coproporphyrinogen III oxidase [Actinomycetales bacterium]|nr:coproporphyrinogen III oxidase [Actinomycetales bacterium]
MNSGRDLGFYLHVPFCASRCGYCDFNTYTAAELGADAARISKDTWAEFAAREIALARESEHLATDERRISTVFFGGGTPTLVPPAHLVATLAELRHEFGLETDAEVTTEANPDSIDAAGLAELRAGGFTRVSFGHQSSAPSVLRVLERSHTPGRTLQAVADARAAGFEHINIDLIYATPGETESDLRRTLDDVIASGANHVSAYSLIVEPGTRLAARVRRGDIAAPDDDTAAQRYQLIDEALRAAGFEWYEVSNWAKPGAHCRHNLVYWRNHDWWGVGPGAHSHMRGRRWWNHKHPARWAGDLVAGHQPVAGDEDVDAAGQALELVMLGLRLREGISTAALAPEALARAREFAREGLLDAQALQRGRAVLTDAGRLLADAVVRDLTP